MMRFVAVVTVAFLLCAGGGAADQKVDISNQLSGLDVPEGLQQFLGAMVTKMQVVEAELRNKTLVEEELRGEISWLKKDRDVFQNKTRAIEAELRREKQDKAALWMRVIKLESHTQKDIRRINARLDQCEANTFAEVVERREMQEQTPACGREAVDSMLAVCCAAPAGNGHRLQESVGCDSLPPTCSLQCSYQFISIFDSCHDQALMRGLSAEQLADWTSFYAVCSEVEQSAAEMSALQPVNVRMFRIMISSDAAQSQAEMFGGDGQTEPVIGPLPELPPPPPASADSGSTEVQEYHAQCTTANILTCVPECNATHHGFELLATIDGTDTKFSCNLANQLFSWVGAAALGGFLGKNVQAFVPAVISGAAGTYVLTLTEDAHVGTGVTIQPGQNVIISGDAGLAEAPKWGIGGFHVRSSLSLSKLVMSGVITTDDAHVHLDSCTFIIGGPGQPRFQSGSAPTYLDARILVRGGDFVISNCSFLGVETNCQWQGEWRQCATYRAMQVEGAAMLNISDSNFSDCGSGNSVDHGGALRIKDDATVLLSKTLFLRNRVGRTGCEAGFCYSGDGGAIHAGDSSELSIDECTFIDNYATLGSAIRVLQDVRYRIARSSFQGNVDFRDANLAQSLATTSGASDQAIVVTNPPNERPPTFFRATNNEANTGQPFERD